MDVIVTNTTNYDILISNQWLHKAKAIIDLNAQQMQILYHGQKMQIPINVNKGVLPEMEEEQEEDEQEEAYMVTTHKKKKKVGWMSKEEWCKKITEGYAPQGVCPHGI